MKNINEHMKFFITVLVAFGITFQAQAQEETTKQQPKVGLVLSGGGAKGFAHIGVLKVIDSLGIKVEYVAGTSMGAIVGSLYASGYSGKQLDSIFKSLNFDDVVSDSQTETGSMILGGEEGIEYLGKISRRNAHACIGNSDGDETAAVAFRLRPLFHAFKG